MNPRRNRKLKKRAIKLFLKIKMKKMSKNGWPQILLRQLLKPKLSRKSNLMIIKKIQKRKRPKRKKKNLRQNPAKLNPNQ